MEAQSSSALSAESPSQREIYSHQQAHDGQWDSDVPTSLSAPTRCMMIFDLQWKVFQLVHDTFNTVCSRNQTLLALALTCKSFTKLALDLLWQDLRGLAPLVRCLPQSLWKHVEGKLEFQRPMTFDDWLIFSKYAHRVRSLNNTTIYGMDPLDIEIWRTLSCPPFFLPLLPNLMSLIWSEAATEKFIYIRLFVTPKLKTLNISNRIAFGLTEQSVLLSIPMLCPAVSDLSLYPLMKSGDMSSSLQRWSHLSYVSIGEVSEAAILHLSNSPSLQFLKFYLSSMPISADTQKLLRYPAFCALQELHIKCVALELVDAFMETLSIAPKVLSITINNQPDTQRALPISISRLSNACVHSSLQQVQLHINDRSDSFDAIGAAPFQPLYAMRNLRKLDFEVNLQVHLDEASLLQMAMAWPLLEELYFNRDESDDVTPHAFVLLLQHCPCLVSVGIAVDWSTIDGHDISPDVPYQGFAHEALSRAFFGAPRIYHPARIAAFISAIAPNMKSIQVWDFEFSEDDPDCDTYTARWDLVQDLIKSFSTVRDQGRRMVLNAGGEANGKIRSPYGHCGVMQPAQETESREAAVGGNVGWD
ncbi:hypothetical protein DEU56DRAFT_808797 [Suillus clintonianus]|uniref:uncharacterized protein n=1 Tax=Suillus clintonianus TaxID=1904413 RepID=UPI001B87D603|nr:uncharacterized protein DEU56DRAFT_808797 [Suillus clintonianus]KAG2134819.1 hypothetical protein DEU56DRAFT_808797 [Suillus clintonianus]